jgi:Zn-dependent protease with chaperone function
VNFFDAQDRARRATRWLIAVYAIATVLIVAGVTAVVGAALYFVGSPGLPPDRSVLLVTAVLATLLIVGSTLYRTAALSAGGSRVAVDMGGTPVPPDVQDPLRRRLRNVVEEISIASGVPVPDIYVLEAEAGINAFAAGYSPGDAAIAVTRGALDVLNRDELQGVIAHEFSHILNGDMRINIRMMGVLFGVMVLSLIGRIVLRGGYHSGAVYSRRNRNAPVIMTVGVGLVILGWIGVLSARMIKAAVSRQRESLADASAVQFTRQTQGLANALKKIGGYSEKSYLRAADPEEVSHMLFARGSRLASLFATHPPLVERIQALDPTFREEDFPRIVPQPQGPSQMSQAMGLAETPAGSAEKALDAVGYATQDARSIVDTVGNPGNRQIAFAKALRQSVPDVLYGAAHGEATALLLALALVLDRSGRHLDRQLHLVAEQFGAERTAIVKRYYEELLKAGPQFSLPLLEISFPALKQRPAAQLQFLVEIVRRLVETDGETDLFEYCFYRVLVASLDPAGVPLRRRDSPGLSRRAARRAALRLLRIFADLGHDEPSRREAAFRAGARLLGAWTASTSDETRKGLPPGRDSVAELDKSLDLLRGIGMSAKERLVKALSAVVGHDRRLTVVESELMRAICAGLDCPLPPLLIDHPIAPTPIGERSDQARHRDVAD